MLWMKITNMLTLFYEIKHSCKYFTLDLLFSILHASTTVLLIRIVAINVG